MLVATKRVDLDLRLLLRFYRLLPRPLMTVLERGTSFMSSIEKWVDPCATRYLGLLKKTLTGTLYDEGRWTVRGTGRNLIHRMVIAALRKRSISLISSREFDPMRRERGEDWPVIGFTMVGVKRLDNIHNCIARVIADKVAGDFVECGVWRGGASIFVRAAFDVYGATDRTVWLAASFSRVCPNLHRRP
jgi:hypothetical protein